MCGMQIPVVYLAYFVMDILDLLRFRGTVLNGMGGGQLQRMRVAVKQGESVVSQLYNIQDILDNLTLFAMGWDAMGVGATTGVWGKKRKGLNL